MVIEDDELLCDRWAQALANENVDVESVGGLSVARARIAQLASGAGPADYVALDLKLPDGSGSELLEELLQLVPRPVVCIVSAYIDARCALRLQRDNVLVVPKPIAPDQMRELVTLMENKRGRHELPMAKHCVDRVCKDFELTEKETEVVQAAMQGLSDKDIAQRLGIGLRTLDTHWERLRDKMRCRTAREVGAKVLHEVVLDLEFTLGGSLYPEPSD